MNNEHEAREKIKLLVKEYYYAFKENKKTFESGDRIAYASRVFDESEMQYLADAMLDFWLTTGRFSSEFETKLSNYLGMRFVSLVNSGSSANLLAFMCLTAKELQERQIKRGDEVICVACAFPTTVAPIIQYGAIPVFVDVTIPHANIDASMLEDAYSEKTKAVFIAHTLGNPFNLKEVKSFCDKYGLWMIEDNCDALGAEYTIVGERKRTGAWGDISTCSFYPPHHVTMGEGGAVCTSNRILSKLIRSYRDWGRDCICPSGVDNICKHRFVGEFGMLPKGYDHKYVYSHFGYNLKATDLQAAIGCAQLDKLPSFISKRRKNWERLYNGLSALQDELILPEAEPNSNPSWFGFLISIKEESGISRDYVTHFLENRNIQTRLLFSGNIIRHPCFDEIRNTNAYRVVGDLKNTDYIMRNAFWVGVYPGLNEEMIDYMIESIKEAIRH